VKLLARTDANGVYRFTGLGQGEYILEVAAKGFSTVTSKALHLQNGESQTADFQLNVAALNETVVVVAAGTPQRTDEVSKAVTILEGKEIEERRELSLTEALRGTPGVRVQQQGSPGALTSWRLRGLRNFDTSLLLDGLRIRDASDINGSALPLLTDLVPVGLDRVEVLRGSGSSIYGTNAIGGVVNIVPGTGSGSPRFETSFEGGTLALFRERIQGSGGIGDRAGYTFGLSRFDVRNGVDGEDEYGNTAGTARVTFNVSPSITLASSFYGTSSNARINSSPFGLPGAFSTGSLYPDAVSGVTFQSDFNNPDSGRRNVLLAGSVRFSQRVNKVFSYSVAYQHVTTRRRNYDGPLVDPRYASFVPFGDFVFNDINKASTDTLDARANFRLGESNIVTAGFEFERESYFQQFLSLFAAEEGSTDRQRTFAVFGQEQFFALEGRLQLSLGVRAQFYRLSPADRPGFLQSVNADNSLTGDGAIAYLIHSTGTKLRAHVGNGFRAPSLFERFGEGTFANLGFTRFGDPTIRAEQSISVDGGFDQRIADNRVMFGMTYFYTRLQRAIAFTSFQGLFNPTAPPDPLGLGRSSGYVNRPGGVARGLENYVEAAPWQGMNLRASYTYTNSDRFVPALGLQPEYVIPNHLFGLNLNQRYKAFLFNFDLNHTGSYIAPVFENDFPFRTAELTFDGYTKADLFGSYERPLTERTRMIFFLGADNIFNQKYFENGFRAPGILGRVGLKVLF
jgi:iron complex outermembrane receptor protein